MGGGEVNKPIGITPRHLSRCAYGLQFGLLTFGTWSLAEPELSMPVLMFQPVMRTFTSSPPSVSFPAATKLIAGLWLLLLLLHPSASCRIAQYPNRAGADFTSQSSSSPESDAAAAPSRSLLLLPLTSYP